MIKAFVVFFNSSSSDGNSILVAVADKTIDFQLRDDGLILKAVLTSLTPEYRCGQ